jgi:hypothetical protein
MWANFQVWIIEQNNNALKANKSLAIFLRIIYYSWKEMIPGKLKCITNLKKVINYHVSRKKDY